jgi:hypothetical protein
MILVLLSFLKSLAVGIQNQHVLANNWTDSRGPVVVVIPKSDHRLRKIVLITERAQARWAEYEILGNGACQLLQFWQL